MSGEIKKFSIMGPDAIIKFNNTDLGTGKVPNEEIIAMANVMQKLEEVTENLPSKKVNEVVEQLKTFMQTLTLSDCEVFARDVRRMLDNLIEIRHSNNCRADEPVIEPTLEDVIKSLPNNHPWLNTYEAKRIKELNFFKDLSRKLDAISKLETTDQGPESNGSKVDSDVSTEIDNRLSSLEIKIELLLSLINTMPGINVPVEKKI